MVLRLLADRLSKHPNPDNGDYSLTGGRLSGYQCTLVLIPIFYAIISSDNTNKAIVLNLAVVVAVAVVKAAQRLEFFITLCLLNLRALTTPNEEL